MNGNEVGIGVILLLTGLFLVGMGYFFYSGIQEDIEAGQAVNATVLETSIDRDVSRDPGETTSSTTYQPIVNYTYTVNDTSYQNTDIFPGGAVAKSDREWAASVIDEYEPGTTVQAYYLANNPSEAYLQEDNPSIVPLLFMVGGALLIAGSGFKILQNL